MKSEQPNNSISTQAMDLLKRVTSRLNLELPKSGGELERAFHDPLLRNAFFVAKVPVLAFIGASVAKISRTECQVDLPFSWRSQNPFHSIYFGAQAAAAELSTGALVLRAIADLGLGPESVSMLVVSMDAKFGKKAKSLTAFYCGQGEAIHDAVLRASKGEHVTLEVETVGRMADGAEVSRFRFVWAVKAKSTAPRSGDTTRSQ